MARMRVVSEHLLKRRAQARIDRIHELQRRLVVAREAAELDLASDTAAQLNELGMSKVSDVLNDVPPEPFNSGRGPRRWHVRAHP